MELLPRPERFLLKSWDSHRRDDIIFKIFIVMKDADIGINDARLHPAWSDILLKVQRDRAAQKNTTFSRLSQCRNGTSKELQ